MSGLSGSLHIAGSCGSCSGPWGCGDGTRGLRRLLPPDEDEEVVVGSRLLVLVAAAHGHLREPGRPQHQDELVAEPHPHRERALVFGDELTIVALLDAHLDLDGLVERIDVEHPAPQRVLEAAGSRPAVRLVAPKGAAAPPDPRQSSAASGGRSSTAPRYRGAACRLARAPRGAGGSRPRLARASCRDRTRRRRRSSGIGAAARAHATVAPRVSD